MELKSNLKITVRERGKIVMRREGHNIWLNSGRLYLAQLISYATFGPDTFFTDLRIRYMGFGIGGNQASPFSDLDPLLATHYPGTHIYSDTDPTQQRLERPVRQSWTTPLPTLPVGIYPVLAYDPGDVFQTQVDPAIVEPVVTARTFSTSFSTTDFNGPGAFPGFFLQVPLSEIALFAAGGLNTYGALAAAYDTFDPIPKTQNFGFDVQWTVRF